MRTVMTNLMQSATTPAIAISKHPVTADNAGYIRRRRDKMHGKAVANSLTMPLTEIA